MDKQLLINVGLTKPQAAAYLALIAGGSLTPPQLATKINESRTNAYKVLDRLVEMKLAHKKEENKKLVYRPANPVALETLARQARDKAMQQEKQVRDTMPALLSYFYTFSERPGIRFYQGKDGLDEIFKDMLRTRQPIYLLRSTADVKFYDQTFFDDFRQKRAKLGITTYGLTPNVATATHNADVDKQHKFLRTWLPASAYTAAVEWNVYGNKVAIISYGEEAIGTIIDSPQIAESFRQIFKLIQNGLS